jgi:iron complex transport system substrate-binding protein
MAARSSRLIALVLALLAGAARVVPASGQASAGAASNRPQRIVSLVPSITEELFAIGAGPQVVGVSNFDTFPDAVKSLPRVGGLLDPDTERILALRPDLVVVYGSQTELETRFARAGVRTFSYRHAGIANVLDSIRQIALLTGHVAEGDAVIRAVQTQLDDVRRRIKGKPRPRTLLVMDRQPGTLREVYVSGGSGFLHEMLDIAGGENVFADVKRESVQPSTETLLAKSPEVIVEVRAERLGPSSSDDERKVWAPLASVSAVRSGRIYVLAGEYLVVPGPRMAQGVVALARTLHPDAFR